MKLFVGIRNNRKNVLFVQNISDFQIFPPCLIMIMLKITRVSTQKDSTSCNKKMAKSNNDNEEVEIGIELKDRMTG